MGKKRKPEDWNRWDEYNRTGKWPAPKGKLSGSQFDDKSGDDKPDKPRGTGGVKAPKPTKPKTPSGGATATVEQPTLFDLPVPEAPVSNYYWNH